MAHKVRRQAIQKQRVQRKRRKYKVRWKAVIPLFAFFALLLYFIGSLLFRFLPWNQMTTICGFNKEETLEAINTHYASSYTVSDYFFYGEVLNLYTKDYTGEKNELQGKKIILENLCDKTIQTFEIGEKADEQILIPQLNAGFYSIFIEDETGAKLRLVYDEVLEENSYTSIVRNQVVKKVSLHSDPKYLGSSKYTFDKNYLFLEVKEEKPSKDRLDVLIDPYGNNRDENNQLDQGQVYYNIVEYKESYAAALQLKELLEKQGLRVGITKQSANEETQDYGENSRFKSGYEQQANYYIKLGFNGSPYEYAKGFEIMHSSYSSSVFAQKVWQYMLEHTPLQGSTMKEMIQGQPGLLSSSRIEGMDGKELYDEALELREVGGKATLAGMYSLNSRQNTFALDQRLGMYGLDIELLYLSNREDVTLWKEQKEAIIESLADALLYALQVKSE